MYGAPGRFIMGICMLKKYKRSFFQNSFGFVCDVFKLCGNDPISWMAWVVGLGWIQKHATPG
jgi:hypothetical protein